MVSVSIIIIIRVLLIACCQWLVDVFIIELRNIRQIHVRWIAIRYRIEKKIYIHSKSGEKKSNFSVFVFLCIRHHYNGVGRIIFDCSNYNRRPKQLKLNIPKKIRYEFPDGNDSPRHRRKLRGGKVFTNNALFAGGSGYPCCRLADHHSIATPAEPKSRQPAREHNKRKLKPFNAWNFITRDWILRFFFSFLFFSFLFCAFVTRKRAYTHTRPTIRWIVSGLPYDSVPPSLHGAYTYLYARLPLPSPHIIQRAIVLFFFRNYSSERNSSAVSPLLVAKASPCIHFYSRLGRAHTSSRSIDRSITTAIVLSVGRTGVHGRWPAGRYAHSITCVQRFVAEKIRRRTCAQQNKTFKYPSIEKKKGKEKKIRPPLLRRDFQLRIVFPVSTIKKKKTSRNSRDRNSGRLFIRVLKKKKKPKKTV